jgi:hypothetical protein
MRWPFIDEQTQRMAVPGGWIYRQVDGPPDRTICMVYVPAPPWHRASQAIRSVAGAAITREPADATPDAVPDPRPAWGSARYSAMSSSGGLGSDANGDIHRGPGRDGRVCS